MFLFNLPEPVVKNLNINGNLISWDKLDNVRGYIVWQVKKGSVVDTTNISHLYDYVQSTSIEVEDGYDYYVSSVNLANEISKPVLASSLSEPEQLVAAFNSIKFPVSISDDSYLNSLKARYDALTESDKAKVSNYSLLESALEQLATIKALEIDAKLSSIARIPCLIPRELNSAAKIAERFIPMPPLFISSS